MFVENDLVVAVGGLQSWSLTRMKNKFFGKLKLRELWFRNLFFEQISINFRMWGNSRKFFKIVEIFKILPRLGNAHYYHY